MSGPWEEGSLGCMGFGDVGVIVRELRNGKGCFGVMQVGHGLALG